MCMLFTLIEQLLATQFLLIYSEFLVIYLAVKINNVLYIFLVEYIIFSFLSSYTFDITNEFQSVVSLS